MKSVYNQELLLWAIGILQPVAAAEVQRYFELVFDEAGKLPDVSLFQQLCMIQEKEKRLVRVSRDPDLFTLTDHGNNYLSKRKRLSRDKIRLYLLKRSREGRLIKSCEDVASELGGVAPSVDDRFFIKGREANKAGLSLPQGQLYWPRFSMQLIDETGQSQPSHGPSFLPFLSFSNITQLAVASLKPAPALELDYQTIGLMLGISPRLIAQIAFAPTRHYRQFDLVKRGGGKRSINSPRTFLKVIQQFLADYYYICLPVHESVHSYRLGGSINSNASLHTGKQFVAGVDISDFFGSVTSVNIHRMLMDYGLSNRSAEILVKLSTFHGVLPQGAPTSPVLSNAYLYDFDVIMDSHCSGVGLTYSRYADDLTVSGDNKAEIVQAIGIARDLLRERFALEINDRKTRIVSAHGQQRVTGIVVNEQARPPRDFRRGIRAAFNNARKEEKPSPDLIRRLTGYMSYLSSFEALKEGADITRYREVLQELKRRAEAIS